MKKTILLVLILALVKFSFAQNKKEQIEILNNRVDSLKIAFQNENSIKKDLESQKVNLQLKISEQNVAISELNLSNSLFKDSLNLSLKNTINLESTYQNILRKNVELNAQLDSKKDNSRLSEYSNNIIDSLYRMGQSKNLISINEIKFRSRENFIENNIEIRQLVAKDISGTNLMVENKFLFILFSSKSLPLINKLGLKTINISVLNQGKVINNRSYYWSPENDGNYYIWFPLEKKYFNCDTESKFKIDIKEDKSKALISSEIIKYEGYCEID
jgi:hypothetical protein